MSDLPNFVPTQLIQGTTAEWSASFEDYPATAWTLSYEFRGADSLSVTAVADGSGYTVSVTKSETAGMLPGVYQYQAFVLSQDATERYMVDSGSCVVIPDFAGLTQADETQSKTPSRRMYDTITQLLATESNLKTMGFERLESLYRQWMQLKWDVKREEDAERVRRGGGQSRKIYTRFTEVC